MPQPIAHLPALPAIWEEGHITGLKARGGFTIDIYWSNNVLDKAVIKSRYDSKINLIDDEKTIPLDIKKGDTFTYKRN